MTDKDQTSVPDVETGDLVEFPVVGIGASAGGLESLERLFSEIPVDTGMAFVVLQHLSPDFKSVMDELLARRTAMPVLRSRATIGRGREAPGCSRVIASTKRS